MTPETTLRLREAAEAGRLIAAWTAGLSRDQFVADPLRVAACRYNFAVVGEALTRVRRVEPAVLDQISEFMRIIGFRNLLVHHYEKIDDGLMWTTIQTKLPVFLAELDTLLSPP